MSRVPRLSKGWHRTPADGWCLMELTSVLAGEVWSDRPACVHPVLACVARCVNDRSSEDGRRELLPFATEVIGTEKAPAGPLVAHCVRRAGITAPRWWPRSWVVTRAVRALTGDEVLRRLLGECVAICREATEGEGARGTGDEQAARGAAGGRRGHRAAGRAGGGGAAGDPRARPVPRRDHAHAG
ncbi:hypothetical protein [Lentzea xinjiangensis]|uniref:hypothetical protein n=1 Tax=Lentzea xinjiangensis TaxID=402600 RepID=UPI001FECF530|nr:hypothetical protein [Lentzea xinjiangensis]